MCRVAAPMPQYTPAAMGDMDVARDVLIGVYFEHGYRNKDIIQLLLSIHGISLSLSHLKRLLKKRGLKRRVPCTRQSLECLISTLQVELQTSAKCLGYKAMWKRLKKKGINVPRLAVRHALKMLDPVGVEQRKRRRFRRRNYINPGPNFCWHVDGYDKLKPFGFAIHGAIDGYSRKIIWIEVGPSNNNPMVVTSYYLDAVLQAKCVPCTMRCDLGTENVHLASLKPYFTWNSDGPFAGPDSFMYGKSTSNQRIEAWWAILRRQGMEFWISTFKDMRDMGVFNTHNRRHIQSIRFAFLNLIRQNLYELAIAWNQHRVDAKPSAESPKGVPDLLYYLPEQGGTHNFGVLVDCDEVESFRFNIERSNLIPHDHDPEFVQYVNTVLPEWEEPTNVEEALQLFADITDTFANEGNWYHCYI